MGSAFKASLANIVRVISNTKKQFKKFSKIAFAPEFKVMFSSENLSIETPNCQRYVNPYFLDD